VRNFAIRIVCGLLRGLLSSTAVKINHFRPKRVRRITARAALGLATDRPASPRFHSDKSPELPLSIKSLRNQYYLGWSFPDITDEDGQTVEQNGGPDAVIQGDFNDEGYRDYAVLTEQDAEAHDHHVTSPLTILIVAFFRTHNGYRRQQVTDEGGGCLQLMPKGQRDYDAQGEFTYQRDTIFSGFGMGGTSYLYENGKFRAIITSD